VLFINAELDFLFEELSPCGFFDGNQWGMFTAIATESLKELPH
jgi:hypothetical protein